MATKKKQLSFEEKLQQVEQMISLMEDGKMPLEELLTQYEEGMKVLSGLEKELTTAQQRLTVLRQGADGVETEVPLEGEA